MRWYHEPNTKLEVYMDTDKGWLAAVPELSPFPRTTCEVFLFEPHAVKYFTHEQREFDGKSHTSAFALTAKSSSDDRGKGGFPVFVEDIERRGFLPWWRVLLPPL